MASHSSAAGKQQQQQQQPYQQAAAHRQKLLEQLQQRKADYVSRYELPLKYPATIISSSSSVNDDGGNDVDKNNINNSPKLRTSADFVNARLLEAGLPLGSTTSSSSSASTAQHQTLANHSVSIKRFIRNLEGTGCYDSVQIHLSNCQKNSQETCSESALPVKEDYDVTVQLQEKKWYKLYIGGGVNSDDLSSLGSSSTSSSNGIASFGSGSTASSSILPKLQFETSASLLNLTGYTDISSASYVVDQTGSTSFNFTHDRPLISYLNKDNALRRWLMPNDPRIIDDDTDNTLESQSQQQYMDELEYALLGGGSHTSLGLHAKFHDVDYEATRSSKEFVRSAGIRLANHSAGAAGGGASYRPSTSPPETMAGRYLFLDWNVSLKDILPKRSPTHPFVLDCSPEIARQCGTYLKHSLTTGLYLNGCFVNDRYDPTAGYDAHVVGEVAGPPGDVGYCKIKGGYSCHFPIELLRALILGNNNNNNDMDTRRYMKKKGDNGLSQLVNGAALHSSFNFGIIHPLTFNGLIGSSSGSNSTTFVVPSSDRFYIGGPGQLRGFLPAGIGPRSNNGGSNVPGGDALGGDLFYTTILASSIPFPSYFSVLRNNGARIFGFANAGTCVSVNSLDSSGLGIPLVYNQILKSTRISIGGGVSVGSPGMGRFEATYAIPIRYGPRDARKSVQFGFGFSFGG